MEAIKLEKDRLDEFREYCLSNSNIYDEYFLSKKSLNEFDIERNITYIIIELDKIVGVFSIMLQEVPRVRIFHVISNEYESYKLLHEVMLKDVGSNYKYNTFIPIDEVELLDFMERLGHEKNRIIYVLYRDKIPYDSVSFNDSFKLRQASFPDDAKDWCEIRNKSFKELKGFIPYPVSKFQEMNTEADYIAEATFVLLKDKIPVGIIKASKDYDEEENFGFIGPIAVLPEYQGKGLGRNMLRAVIKEISNLGYRCSLCVNADNEDATKLYLSEGFYEKEVVVAMSYDI